MITRTALSLSALSLCAACAARTHAPPRVALDPPPIAAVPTEPRPVEIVEVPRPLPLPGQLKPISVAKVTDSDPRSRILRANATARMQPLGDQFVNATQIWPYVEGALYQLYTSPGHVTDIALEPGEQLISVSAGDTVRWIVGDTTSGEGALAQVHILVKPSASGLNTNLIINSTRRTYLLELSATPATWMASAGWSYPKDRLLALRAANAVAMAGTPLAPGLSIDKLNFRYLIKGAKPAWRPLRAFDDGQKVYVEFPSGIAQGDMPPLFVIGPTGDAELVNYRVNGRHYIVDRLFGAAELRLGGKRPDVVRIERSGQ